MTVATISQVNEGARNPCAPFCLKNNASRVNFSLVVRGKPVSKVRKYCGRAKTQRHAGWSSKDWKSKSKTRWQSSAVEHAVQISNDRKRSCKESAKRESELSKMRESAANDSEMEDNARCK